MADIIEENLSRWLLRLTGKMTARYNAPQKHCCLCFSRAGLYSRVRHEIQHSHFDVVLCVGVAIAQTLLGAHTDGR